MRARHLRCAPGRAGPWLPARDRLLYLSRLKDVGGSRGGGSERIQSSFSGNLCPPCCHRSRRSGFTGGLGSVQFPSPFGGAGNQDEVLELSATSSIPLSDGTRPYRAAVHSVLSEPHPVGTLAGLIPASAAADRRARCKLCLNYVTAGNNRAQSQRDSAFIHVSFLSSNFKNEMTGGFFPPHLNSFLR